MIASVIITTYKRSDFLMRAVESCLSQDFQGSMEVIVVDDNGEGSDRQNSNVKNLQPHIEAGKIRYVAHKKNKGACAARNTGATFASGEYLFFLDDDDEFLPRKVSTQVSFLEKNPEFGGHACAFIKKRNGEDFPSTDGLPVIGDLKHFLMYGNIYTPMLCLRKDIFGKSGGFRDIPKFQDMFFVCILLSQNVSIFASEEALFTQNEHIEERISNRSIKNAQVAVSVIQEFSKGYSSLFSEKEWKQVQIRFTLLLATTYYSGSYFNRLRSNRYWIRCYTLSKQAKYLYPMIKSIFPNSWIKTLEQTKSKV